MLVGFLLEVIQFVGNCLYWIAFSAGLASLADSKQHWIRGKISRKGSVVLHGAGNGKEWESPCEGVVKTQLCY